MWWVIGAVVVSYILIVLEKWHRTTIVFFFATLLIVFRLITLKEAWLSIDFNTLGLLFGMMIVVNVMKRTGIFEYLSFMSLKLSGGSIFKLYVLLMIITALTSALLDNVTTVMLITPISMFIADMLGISPYPFFIGEIMASNIGGTATLIGDPPNVMIGSYAHLSFMDFLLNLTPVVIVIFIAFIFYLKRALAEKYGLLGNFKKELMIEPVKAIKNRSLLYKSLGVFGLILTGFMLHHLIELPPSAVALFGAALLLILTGIDPEEILKETEWATLIFLGGFFVLVGGLEKYGVIERIAEGIVSLTHSPVLLSVLIVFISAIVSSILDNIPFVAAMLPVIAHINHTLGIKGNVLWWALALGSCLGGNGTIVGASANIVVAGISSRSREPLNFKNYLKHGVPVTLISILISALYVIFLTIR